MTIFALTILGAAHREGAAKEVASRHYEMWWRLFALGEGTLISLRVAAIGRY
ncbi:MAG: hypothetical protein ACJASX_003289 [Limisphaerales bacterium]|jgi:hypothetical protein